MRSGSRTGHSMFDGLPRGEIVGWVVCLVLATGLTLFGSVYLVAPSLLSADVTDALKQTPHSSLPPPHTKRIHDAQEQRNHGG